MTVSKLIRPPGHLKRILKMPCQIPWSFAAELTPIALVEAIVGDINLDLKEIYHLTSGSTLNHAIYSSIAEAPHNPTPFFDGVSKFLGQLGAFADMAAFRIWLAGIAKDGLIDFVTMAHDFPTCQQPMGANSGYADEPFLAIEMNSWQHAWQWFTDQGKFAPEFFTQFLLSTKQVYYMCICVQCRTFDGSPVPVKIRIREDFSGTIYDTGTGKQKTASAEDGYQYAIAFASDFDGTKQQRSIKGEAFVTGVGFDNQAYVSSGNVHQGFW